MLKRWWRWTPALLLCLFIFISTSSPGMTADSTREYLGPLNILVRKAAHIITFGVLALLFRFALGPGRGMSVAAWGLTTLYAVSDEWHQTLVPGRGASAEDVALDAAGAALALLIWAGARQVVQGRYCPK